MYAVRANLKLFMLFRTQTVIYKQLDSDCLSAVGDGGAESKCSSRVHNAIIWPFGERAILVRAAGRCTRAIKCLTYLSNQQHPTLCFMFLMNAIYVWNNLCSSNTFNLQPKRWCNRFGYLNISIKSISSFATAPVSYSWMGPLLGSSMEFNLLA